MDQVAIRIEGAEQSRLIELRARLSAFQRILGHEKDSLHRAVVSPKAHSTPRGVIKAALIRKIQRHRSILIAHLDMAQLGWFRRAARAAVCRLYHGLA